MKKADLGFIIVTFIIISPFLPFPFLADFQKNFLFNEQYWLITSFLKFALLATLGESLGLRIKNGVYTQKGFGLIPRAVVWGFLGIVIKMAFVIFAVGVPVLLDKFIKLEGAVASMGYGNVLDAFDAGAGWVRVLTAFSISVLLNLIFAPVFMTFHKITDTHILDNGGTLHGFFRWIKYSEIFPRINWFVQWDFVFKRTIPFFWIPAHTITFMLPKEYQIIFAAILGIVLGVFMATASLKGSQKKA
ncbi:MAG: hypothetical protein KKA07_02970 [Bacteroidetes bacterium]|nr:hypothetical protein [Bacteroidota bacterium]MBU1718012.1 hypothetical protein [Bacteroidota bacterium]